MRLLKITIRLKRLGGQYERLSVSASEWKSGESLKGKEIDRANNAQASTSSALVKLGCGAKFVFADFILWKTNAIRKNLSKIHSISRLDTLSSFNLNHYTNSIPHYPT